MLMLDINVFLLLEIEINLSLLRIPVEKCFIWIAKYKEIVVFFPLHPLSQIKYHHTKKEAILCPSK